MFHAPRPSAAFRSAPLRRDPAAFPLFLPYTFAHSDFPSIPCPPLQLPWLFHIHAPPLRPAPPHPAVPRLSHPCSLAYVHNTAASLSWSVSPLTSPHLPFPPRHPSDPFRSAPPRRAASLGLMFHPRRLPAPSLPLGPLTSIRPPCRYHLLLPSTSFYPARPCHAPSLSHPLLPPRIPAPLLNCPSPFLSLLPLRPPPQKLNCTLCFWWFMQD